MLPKLTRNDNYRFGVTDDLESRIIGYFITLKDNRTSVIASKLKIKDAAVSNAINRFLAKRSKSNFVIVESKMNFEDFT